MCVNNTETGMDAEVIDLERDDNGSRVLGNASSVKNGKQNVTESSSYKEVSTNDVYVSMHGNHVSFEQNRRVRSVSPMELHHQAGAIRPANYIRPCSRKRTLGRDAHSLLNYFKKMQGENPGFYYAIQLDDENHMTNVFWADARSTISYSHFGDAVIFDTMYRQNQYQVPFAPFTGVNHHGQVVLFGCAMLLDETELSFTWLFRTWLSAMNDKAPVSITTDQDRAIHAAAAQVFPRSRHCICKWHILREGQERLAHIYLAYPSFHGELYSCINFSETIEDFESSWSSLLAKYNLRKNEWLHAVFSARKQWAPVYFHDTFFAALYSNQGMICFFDGYLNQQTTIPLFLEEYERAMERSLKKEIEADYDAFCTTPVLKTTSPLEQQAANLYTRKVFAKFQEELVETFLYRANKVDGDELISQFMVAKYEHDHKVYLVTLNITEMKASCSCQKFEYSGILCRHILTVFTMKNVLTLPSHYILKRWSRNANSGFGLDEQNVDPPSIETLTLRFSNLCQEAIQFAAGGSIAEETHDAALSILKEGSIKIAALKKKLAKTTPPSCQGNGNIQEDNKETPSSALEMAPSLLPQQDPMPHHFNLKDVDIPAADLNQPSMTPVSVSIHHDGGPQANAVTPVSLSIHHDGGPQANAVTPVSVSIHHDGGPQANVVVRTCFKSMTRVIDNKNPTPGDKVDVIKLKHQDYGKTPEAPQIVASSIGSNEIFKTLSLEELTNLADAVWEKEMIFSPH